MAVLLLVVVGPLAVMIVVGARVNYDSALQSLQQAKDDTSRALLLQVRTGLSASRRLTGAMGEIASRFAGPSDLCGAMLGHVLGEAPGFVAVRVVRDDGARCEAVQPGRGVSSNDLEAALGEPGRITPLEPIKNSRWSARYSVASLGKLRPIVLTVSNEGQAGPRWTSTLLMDADRFSAGFDTLRGTEVAVALYGAPDAPLLVRGVATPPDRWLPKNVAFRSRLDRLFH